MQANTAELPGSDAAVLRIGAAGRGGVTDRGIAATTDCNGRYCYLDPYAGAQIAFAEAARNLSCVGAEPAAITDCLNFGSPEKPEVFYTFHESVRGLADACTAFGVPVISGNVSFYNESFGSPIHPTPTVGMVGLVDDLDSVVRSSFSGEGDVIVLLGETLEELGGTEYLSRAFGVVSGRPPALDLELEADVQAVVREVVRTGLVSSAHDCSDGGLAVALAESCIGGRLGAVVALDDTIHPAAALFSESQSRVLVSVPSGNVDAVLDAAERHGVPYGVIGEVGGSRIVVEGLVDVDLSEAADRWEHALPRLMGDC